MTLQPGRQTSLPMTLSQRPDWICDDLFPFVSRSIEIEGARLHYVDEGKGPVLLMIHGTPTWSWMYRKWLSALRSSFRCIAVDLPGMGLSEAPLYPGEAFSHCALWLEGFVQALGLKDIVLVTHATGGPPALNMAAQVPTLFRGLVISNTFGWPLETHDFLARMVRIVSSKWFGLINVNLGLLPWVMSRKGRSIGHFSAVEKQALLAPFRQRSARHHLQNYLNSLRMEGDFFAALEEQLPSLETLPVLLLYGGQDNGFQDGVFGKWTEIFPRNTAYVVHRAGHFLLEDAAEPCLEAFVKWEASLA